MASANDVRDILSLPSRRAEKQPEGSQGASNTTTKTGKPSKGRAEGISRELFALLGDNAPSLAIAQSIRAGEQASKFKPKFKRKEARTKRWVLKKFKNPARSDGLILKHWVQEPISLPGSSSNGKAREVEAMDTQDGEGKQSAAEEDFETDYPFAKLNTGAGVHQYSNDEYTQHLKDEDWSKDETDYLVDMCGEYDLRFVVIADRYDFPGGKPRSMEDMKARYYAICRRLIRSRISTEDIETRQQVLQTYAFDKNREIERKKAVARLFSRTPAQLAEEEALYIEARRIEQNEAKFAGEREELLRLLGGWESLQSATPTTIAMAGAGLGVPLSGSAAEAEELKRKKRKAEAESAAMQAAAGPSGINLAVLTPKQKAALKETAFDEQHYIQRFDPNTQLSSRPPYPHLIGTPSTHPPVAPSPHNPSSSHGAYIRSTRLLTAKLTMAQRTQQTLAELVPPIGQRLVFPNAKNCEKWEGLLGAVTSGLEMQKQLERVDAELRIAKARLDAMQGGTKVEEVAASAVAQDNSAGDTSMTISTAGGERTAVA